MMENNQKLMWAWCIGVLVLLFAMFQLASCDSQEETDNLQMQFKEPINDILMEEVVAPVFERYEFQRFGYSSMTEWFDDMQTKNAEAEGIADKAIKKYSRVISDDEETQLREYEKIMSTTLSVAEYKKASDEFDDITDELADDLAALSRPVYSGGGSGGYTGGSTPYNFKQMGVLYDSQWRYTYYSSRVLYHYMTPQWTLGSDGIWRDSAGRVVVACDSLPHGTVINTELFGTCIVLDCGVGRGDTLDVYVGW